MLGPLRTYGGWVDREAFNHLPDLGRAEPKAGDVDTKSLTDHPTPRGSRKERAPASTRTAVVDVKLALALRRGLSPVLPVSRSWSKGRRFAFGVSPASLLRA